MKNKRDAILNPLLHEWRAFHHQKTSVTPDIRLLAAKSSHLSAAPGETNEGQKDRTSKSAPLESPFARDLSGESKTTTVVSHGVAAFGIIARSSLTELMGSTNFKMILKTVRMNVYIS
ncbi:hypothetical protein Q8A67_014097 [Cirrhinus molitorella]|uniref:Uncharacterized protein n=1 Tax=Cirrhinus molitorella TaxID=172907 RepID=A0AA88PMA5_9TELE|nr:hypothetical protein Q8A67_014097 [Cirrhinus molitorella]